MPERVTTPQIVSLPLDSIQPSRHQFRRSFEEESLKGLAESIDKEGLIQPVTVRSVGDGRYELIAGERRFRAMKMLGKDAISAIIVEVPSEAAAAAKGLVENIQRQDLNPMEEAKGYQELQTLDPKYWTQEQIASVAGKTQAYISQAMSLLDLADPIQENIRRLIFSRSQGVELARLPDKSIQLEIAQRAKGGSTQQTRRLVDEALGHKKGSRNKQKVEDPVGGLWPPHICNVVYQSSGWIIKLPNKPNESKDVTRQYLAEIFLRLAEVMKAGPIDAKRSQVPSPVIQEATYIRGNRLQIKWSLLGDGYQYEILKAWGEPDDLSLYKPLDGATPLTASGAIVNVYRGSDSYTFIAVRAIAPGGQESALSTPVRFNLTMENDENRIEPMDDVKS